MDEMLIPIYKTAANKAVEELVSARKLFDTMRGPHEGWAILYEEVCELWDEVRNNKRSDAEYLDALYKEALQVTAMGLAFMVEIAMMGNGVHREK